MSARLTRDAYARLITEDIAWLLDTMAVRRRERPTSRDVRPPKSPATPVD